MFSRTFLEVDAFDNHYTFKTTLTVSIQIMYMYPEVEILMMGFKSEFLLPYICMFAFRGLLELVLGRCLI